MACPFPPSIGFGYVISTGPYNTSSEAIYTCQPGYTMAGIANSLVCVNGLWVGAQPSCNKGSSNVSNLNATTNGLIALAVILFLLLLAALIFALIWCYFKWQKNRIRGWQSLGNKEVAPNSRYFTGSSNYSYGVKSPVPRDVIIADANPPRTSVYQNETPRTTTVYQNNPSLHSVLLQNDPLLPNAIYQDEPAPRNVVIQSGSPTPARNILQNGGGSTRRVTTNNGDGNGLRHIVLDVGKLRYVDKDNTWTN